ncbi:AGAP001907-PA-like protein [Anopheles sinensis]|uniref:AGAP001907-PA-like protein n=1 Tax=Anopheles sinensis TaxID=74873 RepID=A0A084VRY3_ANOSI|nr:AGAP001907-PA-like protein [Anopheles sinensis]
MDVATIQRAEGQDFLHNHNNNNNNNNGAIGCGLEKGKQPLAVVASGIAAPSTDTLGDGSGRELATQKMSSSVASILDDTTPSDSGVQLLDSESSGLNESMISSAGGFEFDVGQISPPPPPPLPGFAQKAASVTDEGNNNNNNNRSMAEMEVEAVDGGEEDDDGAGAITERFSEIDLHSRGHYEDETSEAKLAVDQEIGEGVEIDPAMTASQGPPDELITSTCSTFDSENIVYRRRIKKTPTSKTPKKRVSFHEDILKNTKTDNIHIEHGFITYKSGGGSAVGKKMGHQAGRYSWCTEDDNGGRGVTDYGDEEACEGRQYVYRNACSDVLDYGKTDVFENIEDERNYVKYDNSGIFEYGPPERSPGAGGSQKGSGNFYKCNCSDSNSSLDSGEGTTNERTNYAQAKSHSCECIGSHAGPRDHRGKPTNNNVISDNCYYSEPSIEHLDEFNGNVMSPMDNAGGGEQQFVKSVWSKEKKPKSSCLKKTKRNNIYTNVVVPEYDLNRKVKKFNVHQQHRRLSVIDNSRMIFGSLKDIFGIALPERGVPEGSEDLSSVRECIPETHDDSLEDDFTVVQKPKSFLSKSLDGGFNSRAGGRPSSGQQKKYVHNVDEQLRRKNDEDLYAPSRKNSVEDEPEQPEHEADPNVQQEGVFPVDTLVQPPIPPPQPLTLTSSTGSAAGGAYRNKFIINGESTVFEHTGVSYCFEDEESKSPLEEEKELPVGETTTGSFIGKTQIKKKLSNIFQKINVISSSAASTPTPTPRSGGDGEGGAAVSRRDSEVVEEKEGILPSLPSPTKHGGSSNAMENSMISSCGSENSEQSSVSHKGADTVGKSQPSSPRAQSASTKAQQSNRHLSSPLRKKSLTTTMLRVVDAPRPVARMTPDLFNLGISAASSGRHLDPQLAEEFEDILTVTATAAPVEGAPGPLPPPSCRLGVTEDDLVILDYPPAASSCASSTVITPVTSRTSEDFLEDTESSVTKTGSGVAHRQYHHHRQRHNPMTSSTASSTSTASKSSLINRFLRNVTQKKILEATIKQNPFFQSKVNGDRKLFENLCPRGVRSVNRELIEDLNAEIAMEIEMSSSDCSLDRVQLNDTYAQSGEGCSSLALGGVKFDGGGIGVGELPVELFSAGGRRLSIYRNDSEVLMKVFKLFNGYSREGYMTPVLVFLTDRTLYVTDQVRNRLCNKFVLPYAELDVILVGPYGNTVLLSNSARDMQQVLLAGGPYPAEGLVSSLELCARRGGSVLPAVGQLTLDHLAPLQAFVRDHSSVSRDDTWKYYAVVNVPAGTLGGEEAPLGPHIKGPLMHRRMSHAGFVDNWSAGYFLLKAGVLYLFGDASQKLPTWAVALAECQGARRSVNSGRPYCFELLLRTGALQLAAPDEYVASDWLQALVQAASGLFEMQERRRTLGCTLIMTSNHLLTLREDFSAPLRRNTASSSLVGEISAPPTVSAASLQLQLTATASPSKENINPNIHRKISNVSSTTGVGVQDNCSEISSIRSNCSTPTRTNMAQLSSVDRRSNSSTTSTPTRSSLGPAQLQNTSPARSYTRSALLASGPPSLMDYLNGSSEEKSYTNMSSFYGKNSGVEVLTCASIDEMSAVKIPAVSSNWWCILEFECQEVRENSDDLVVFFSTSAEQERFLSMLESIWHTKKREAFPASIITSDDAVYDHCSKLFQEINRSWEPLLSAALGYPQ